MSGGGEDSEGRRRPVLRRTTRARGDEWSLTTNDRAGLNGACRSVPISMPSALRRRTVGRMGPGEPCGMKTEGDRLRRAISVRGERCESETARMPRMNTGASGSSADEHDATVSDGNSASVSASTSTAEISGAGDAAVEG